MERLTDSVYAETGFNGCNVSFVKTKEGVVMVDTPQIPSEALKWREMIDQYGPIRYLINSEPHSDHFSGNYFFEGTIVGHEGSRTAITNASLEQMTEMINIVAPNDISHLEYFYFCPPTITYSERLTLYLGNHTFQLINLPGHTPFQTAVFIPEERVVMTSDNLLGQGSPFFPPDALPFKWLDSLKRMQQLEADIFIPGHGVICNRDALMEMFTLVQDRIDTVQAAINKGMTLDEAQKKISFQERYPPPPESAEMAQRFQRISIERLYKVLTSTGQ